MFVYGSLLQDGLDSHPVFCIVLCVVVVRISKDGRVAHFWAQVLVWLYVDDMVFQVPLEHVAVLLEVVKEALAAYHLEL